MRRMRKLIALVVSLAGVGGGLPLWGEVKVPALISDNMVLQRSATARRWGTAAPGEGVSVTVATASGSTKADANGKWQVRVDTRALGEGPHELTIKGANTLTIKNVAVGEVWFCSGQSNMEMGVGGVIHAKEEIEKSANPMIRHFQVAGGTSLEPLTEVSGRWVVAAPQTTGGFTAAGYFFAREVNATAKVPVGLIHSSWGGTMAQPWVSAQGLDADPALAKQRDERLQRYRENEARRKAFAANLPAWEQKNKRADTENMGEAAGWHKADAPSEGWTAIKAPDTFRKLKLENAGIVWYRATFEVPQSAVGKELTMNVGHVVGSSIVYVNGQRVGEVPVTTPSSDTIMRNTKIPANVLRAGENVVAVRCHSSDIDGGLRWRALTLELPGGRMSLDKNWSVRVEATFPPLDAAVMATRPKEDFVLPQNVPTMIYNAKVSPVTPYTIAGTLWYQGESNIGSAAMYRTLLPALIADWRKQFEMPEMPFYICQLANHRDRSPRYVESALAELRDAQFVTARKVPNTGVAVLIDVGEAGDIHPKNKQDVGRRLAALALHHTYGKKDVVASGPTFKAATVEGNKMRLAFEDIGGGLVAKPLADTYVVSVGLGTTAPLVLPRPGSQLQGFVICGEDRKWKFADAVIDGESVVVSHPDVAKPVAVRYGWADNPTVNLYNKADLPASPFRTDDFPLITQGK